jgi:transposase-like protein
MQTRISKEIKDEILAKARSGGRVMELSTQYGISSKTIYYWLKVDTGEESVSILKYNKLKRENEELKRLVGELTLGLSQGEKIRAGSTFRY